MMFDKVSFAMVRQMIGHIFNDEDQAAELDLNPDAIHQFAKQAGTVLKWRPILNWEICFEHNIYEYSTQDFLDIAFAKVKPSKGSTIIVTYECFKDNMAFSIPFFKDMLPFMDELYPQLFNMQFAQPSDYIYIQPCIGLITMIHHEGVRTKYSRV